MYVAVLYSTYILAEQNFRTFQRTTIMCFRFQYRVMILSFVPRDYSSEVFATGVKFVTNFVKIIHFSL
jgi:hypothetical protein